jgi:predicted metalloprotease with PDZ domain
VDVVSPVAIGSEFQPSLYAHEIFHSWNVKRMRPSDLWPYRYDRAQPTPWLWVSEGITDYYADLASVRGGVVDAAGFYALTATKINDVGTTPPVSLHDASINTWVHPADGTQYIYYAKGSLAGLMLDIMIRDASDNKHSLDDVMRDVYQTTYKHGRGFTSSDWWGAVSRAAGGKSFTDFAARYVDGRDEFPWDSLLPLVGLRSVIERMPRLGVTTQQDSTGVRVEALDPEGAAQAAGMKVGDYIIAIGDLSVQDQQFGEKFRAMFANAVPGSPIPIRIRRGAATMTLTSQLRLVPGGVRIEADPAASAKAVRIRNGILKGG